ncbi:MAG: hypothetical protein R2801_04610 [Chitinophagales bacterium]
MLFLLGNQFKTQAKILPFEVDVDVYFVSMNFYFGDHCSAGCGDYDNYCVLGADIWSV